MTFSPENKENNRDLKAAHEIFERWNESRTDQRGGAAK